MTSEPLPAPPVAAVPPKPPAWLMAVYVPPIFLGAVLMFWSQLLIGKMVLPLLGGTPMVWTTCMVFFQSLLLAGYAYAHWSMRFGARVQAGLYLALIALALPLLPVGGGTATLPPVDGDPRPWLVGWLALAIGAPFLALSVTGPMLQAWFSRTSHRDAANPYFLYATSNAGSLIGLLAFPALAEPQLTLGQQASLWTWGFAAYGGLIVLAALTLRAGAPAAGAAGQEIAAAETTGQEGGTAAARPSTGLKMRWLALAFAPSSLLLGLTSLVATDIAAVPLIWMLPLAAYLITFMIAFSRRPAIPHWMALTLHPAAVLPPLFFWFWSADGPTYLMLGLHFAAFFLTALVCHGELARTRPAARHLTEFYLMLAVGGALGGLFNSLLAPMIFTRVYEYPLVLVLALFLRPWRSAAGALERRLDLLIPAAWAAALLGVTLVYRENLVPIEVETVVIVSLLLGLFGLRAQDFTLRFGLMAAGLIGVNLLVPALEESTLFSNRNFFGVTRVIEEPDNATRFLFHGTTQHGAQHTDQRRLMPIAYYAADGPLGQAFRMPAVDRREARVAAVGLGAGTLACLADKGQRVTFYEIDPAIARIAANPDLFTYLRDCPARSDVVLGDGRLMLAKVPEGTYDMIVLDAFSSDAIPVHLMTREAIRLYLSRLAENGLLLFHISNRYLELTRVLAPLAADAGLLAFVRAYGGSPDNPSPEIWEATWVALVRPGPAQAPFAADDRWNPFEARDGMPVWTDSFSNLLSTLR